MRILFDQGTPVPLRRYLTNNEVDTVFERSWSKLPNGKLLDAAEQAAYEIFITTDQNLKYQQHLAARKISIIVLLSTSWPRIQKKIDEVKTAIVDSTSGSYKEILV